MTPPIKGLLTAKELAEALSVSLATIYRLKDAGQLPFVQLGGKNHVIRFPRAVLDTVTETATDAVRPKPVSNKVIPGPTPKWLSNRSH